LLTAMNGLAQQIQVAQHVQVSHSLEPFHAPRFLDRSA
jgi:hypothetical protein